MSHRPTRTSRALRPGDANGPSDSKRKSTARRFVGIALVLAITGCAPDGETTATTSSAAEPSSVTTIFASMSAADRRALSDRWVTPAEYRRAVMRSVRCLRDAGFDVSEPRLDTATRLWHFGASVGVDAPGDGRADAQFERCDAEKRPVESVFIANRFDDASDDPVGDYRECLTRVRGHAPSPSQLRTRLARAEERFEYPPHASGRCDSQLKRSAVSPLPGAMEALDEALDTPSPQS